MEAYCMKCKTKREITEAEATFNKIGAPVTRGTCPVCGTQMYRTGRTDAHEGMTPPPKVKREPAMFPRRLSIFGKLARL